MLGEEVEGRKEAEGGKEGATSAAGRASSSSPLPRCGDERESPEARRTHISMARYRKLNGMICSGKDRPDAQRVSSDEAALDRR